MTDAALRQLSHDNHKGFFLMIESASIDKQAHERKPCGSIGRAVQQLEEATGHRPGVCAGTPEHTDHGDSGSRPGGAARSR